jgi:polysaccharide pyruvyl transferase WcaK-like protein
MDRLMALLVRLTVSLGPLARIFAAFGLCRYDVWRPGKKLKVLLVGYNGARNTGADARVVEIVRQFRHVIGADNLEISVLALNTDNLAGYFPPDVKLIKFSSVFFRDVFAACSTHHVAVLCEGSTLKSKFANALTLFFCTAAGLMKRQKKPCIAYGSEAGHMDPFLVKSVRTHCAETYFVSRTRSSLEVIRSLGLQGNLGTDTAWTFGGHPPDWAHERLVARGWDGRQPILGVAAINPFWWPVRPSLSRWAYSAVRRDWSTQYKGLYFFSHSRDRAEAFDRYATALASGANSFARARGAFVAVIAMEALDASACRRVMEGLDAPAALFESREYDAFQLCAVLRKLSVLITSRYHARVLSAPAGVPAVAVSMDERLHNIYDEMGHLSDYYLEASDEQLEAKLVRALERIWDEREEVARRLRERHVRYLETMGNMGIELHRFVDERFPGISLPRRPAEWRHALTEAHAPERESRPNA